MSWSGAIMTSLRVLASLLNTWLLMDFLKAMISLANHISGRPGLCLSTRSWFHMFVSAFSISTSSFTLGHRTLDLVIPFMSTTISTTRERPSQARTREKRRTRRSRLFQPQRRCMNKLTLFKPQLVDSELSTSPAVILRHENWSGEEPRQLAVFVGT